MICVVADWVDRGIVVGGYSLVMGTALIADLIREPLEFLLADGMLWSDPSLRIVSKSSRHWFSVAFCAAHAFAELAGVVLEMAQIVGEPLHQAERQPGKPDSAPRSNAAICRRAGPRQNARNSRSILPRIGRRLLTEILGAVAVSAPGAVLRYGSEQVEMHVEQGVVLPPF